MTHTVQSVPRALIDIYTAQKVKIFPLRSSSTHLSSQFRAQ